MLVEQWEFPPFRPEPRALVTAGTRADEQVAIIKPQTSMNRSGQALAPVLALTDFDPQHDLLILVDDLALPLGTFRLRDRGTAGGHNGLLNIEEALQSQAYGRLRIGVGPLPQDVDDQAEYVLSPFAREELSTLAELLPELADAVDCWIREGMDTAMNRFNRRGAQE